MFGARASLSHEHDVHDSGKRFDDYVLRTYCRPAWCGSAWVSAMGCMIAWRRAVRAEREGMEIVGREGGERMTETKT